MSADATNDEAIRLLRIQRKTALDWKVQNEAKAAAAEAEGAAASAEVSRMVARLEAINRAIVTLGGNPED